MAPGTAVQLRPLTPQTGSSMGMPNEIVVKVRVPTTKYADELLQCHCAVDLLGLELFPNFKEITESFAAYNAVRKHLWTPCRLFPSDESITLISVGDGGTPRTGATFAFRTRWQCLSVDPVLNEAKFANKINRLQLIQDRLENVAKLGPYGRAVVVAVHAHVGLDVIVNSIAAERLALVAIPCCTPQTLDQPPDEEYDDWGIWSPQRCVKVWRQVEGRR